MRGQRGIPYAQPPVAAEYAQKDWYADPAYASQGAAPYYAAGGAPPMMLSQYPTQPITYQSYAPYSQGIQTPQPYLYSQFRPEAGYYPEDPQLMIYRQPVAVPPTAVAPPQPAPPPPQMPPPQPAMPPQAPPRSFQSTPPPPRAIQQPPQPTPPAPPPRVEKADIQPMSNASTIDVNTQPRFDNSKYPIPGCFSIIQRGNIPGIESIIF
ncbi:calcium-binding protein, putative [Trichomonas vaginalis G3]|uniref:Calcium-binding protein, putative n=1 Tax=Trichomonas vaginalis (strain ATCC PRA-98 / G3) TaxID=412133 RepID=A2G1G4_TRIV3|nr:uncharacterized protein TVAGG3_1090820 [Trichomonas vaginalis G3]EAX88999.1 calcium-binding protein, putative [Trichomonas vaginalis G3]KAI5482236.1 hypothetical protein TVAGG3_1090820 [Trichomonas vaginalis G3]|eukprot:XP_001301929.1 calcium-binding protein [Trichomonas vaginalis G3]